MLSHIITGFSFLFILMIQYAVISRTNLFYGTADLILLLVAAWSMLGKTKVSWLWITIVGIFVSIISPYPVLVPLIAYLIVFILAQIIKRGVWQTPMLGMFIVTFAGTIFQHVLYLFVLTISGREFSWPEALNMITLPSLLLNMLLSIPVHALIQELSIRTNMIEYEL